MIQETPALTAQRDFSQLLSKVQYQHEQFIITDVGKPVAALVDMALFEKFLQNERLFQEMTDDMTQAFADSCEGKIDALLNESKKA